MSYQVLARKWRPRTFHELVGQQHVSRALINALDQERLHHAYLFTGTRGVGKTTIARIFAKCLNCEQGVTSTPCGECQTCRAIDEGRFVDLIEVDAASRTKVEDTRELLDNVQYAPTQGRFKVYLIDEVHMLSSHSFNALLKTLEEPPPHVKFLLATTDPQKLPVTVLSRCLQFALKAMPPEQVVAHLTHILNAEQVSFEEPALWLLGRAAEGSMRDALSLTDQAISFGHGNVSEGDVRAMLGTLDHRYIINLAESISTVDAAAVLEQVARLSEQAPDFAQVLDELSSLFHRLAVAQMVPDAVDNGFGDRQAMLNLASRFTPEDVQLYYQISLAGRGEMNNAPEPRAALEMTLLRMLAFRPQGIPKPPDVALPIRNEAGGQGSPREAGQQHQRGDGKGSNSDDEPGAAPQVSSAPEDAAPGPQDSASTEVPSASDSRDVVASSVSTAGPPPWASDADANDQSGSAPSASAPAVSTGTEAVPTRPANAGTDEPTPASYFADDKVPASSDADDDSEDDSYTEYAALEPSNDLNEAFSQALEDDQASANEPQALPQTATDTVRLDDNQPIDQTRWLEIFPAINLGGITGNLVANCAVTSDSNGQLALCLDPSQAAMNAEIHARRLEAELARLGAVRKIIITPGDIEPGVETPHAQRTRRLAERRARAVEALRDDPHIKALQQEFGARLIEASVTSHESDATH